MHFAKYLVLVLGVAGVFVSWFASPTPVSACSCVAYVSEAEHFENATTVFEGTVSAISSSNFQKTVAFDVSKTLKGEVDAKQSVTTGMGGGDCGFNFESGQEYIVYAYADAGQLSTGVCSGTSLISDAQDPSDEPEAASGTAESETNVPATLIVVVVLVAGGLVMYVAVRSKS